MASFVNRGTKQKPSWQYTISRMVNGKYKPIRKGGFPTKKAAQVAAAEVEAELCKGVDPHLKPLPFDEYFEEWIRVYKTDVSENTRARYKTSLTEVKRYFAGVPIQDITKRKYQEFLNEYAKTHAKASTTKLNTHIRACVRDAVDEGIIRVDFTRGAVLSGNRAAKSSEEKHISYFESKRLLRAISTPKTPTEYLILLGLTSGMRFGELVGLTRKDFDFENNIIKVDKSWGYTKKMHEGFGPTKNGKSRLVKMSPKIMRLFKDWFERTPDNIYGLVFFSPRSKYKVISNNNANKILGNILDELNIERISIHGLRHTHASVLLYKGVSVYYVADRLGDEIETINEYYAHIIKELRKKDEQQTTKIITDMIS